MTNLYFPICAFFCSLLLVVAFFTKSRVKNKETDLFSQLLIHSFIDSILMVVIIYIGYVAPDNKILYILNKLDFIQYIFWARAFYLYIFYVSFGNKEKLYSKFKTISLLTKIINYIVVIFIVFLPMYMHNQDNIMYAYGPSVNCTYVVSAIYLFFIVVSVIMNIKNVLNKKYIPLFALIVLAIILFVVRNYNPELLVISAILVYIDLIMYFTIENPDAKIVNELEYAKNMAEKANRAKSDFLSSMSHEIRTPLNAIVGLSECIKNSDDIEEIHEDANDVVMASNNLLEIVNGILDISKIEADKMEIIETNYNPVELFEEITTIAKTRIGEKDIDLRCNFAEDIPNTLYGDKGKLKQIITNVLSNAVKYTEEGHIKFNVSCINERDKSNLQIIITDTGRGIKPDQIDKIFNKFERAEEDKNSTIEGTGLGLAITKSLVEMMGGKILVHSTYGEGSKFTIFLEQKYSKTESNTKVVKDEKVSYSDKRVLVVDDNKLNIKVASKMLSEFELNIDSADSGFSAIEKIENNEHYDIIFMDIMMPKMSGVETLKKLKEMDNFNTPVVALTADAMEGKSTKYIEVGFNDYLSKPINKDELKRVLNKCLNGDIEIEEEKTPEEDPHIHRVIPITDEDIEMLNRKMAEDLAKQQEQEKLDKENN